MSDNGRIWTDRQLAQYWDMGILSTRERMMVVCARGKGDLLTLYYWKDEPDSPPIAMRPFTESEAPAGLRAGLGLIFRDCTPDDAPQSYHAQIANVPVWTRYRKGN